MKSIQCIIHILLLILIFSCKDFSYTPDDQDRGNVNFIISSDHFVKNFYSEETNPSYLLIRSFCAFDSLFDVAVSWEMDYSKLITDQKMEEGFVLAIIYQGNDIHVYDIEKIILKDNEMRVYYLSDITIPNASWTCNCHVTILIENCEFDSLRLYENGNLLRDALIKAL